MKRLTGILTSAEDLPAFYLCSREKATVKSNLSFSASFFSEELLSVAVIRGSYSQGSLLILAWAMWLLPCKFHDSASSLMLSSFGSLVSLLLSVGNTTGPWPIFDRETSQNSLVETEFYVITLSPTSMRVSPRSLEFSSSCQPLNCGWLQKRRQIWGDSVIELFSLSTVWWIRGFCGVRLTSTGPKLTVIFSTCWEWNQGRRAPERCSGDVLLR